MKISLIFTERKYGAIDADDSSCNGYYIIKFSSSTYILQSYLRIDGQVISSSDMLWEGTYFLPININSRYYVLQKTKSINTIVSLRITINGDVNVIYYDFKDVISPCLQSISHNYYKSLSPLHIWMKEHDNLMD